MVELLLALLCAFIFQLIYERAEGISVWIVRLGCQLLPKHLQKFMLERIEADLQHIEGPAWKLISAVGFWWVVVPKYLARLLRATNNPRRTGNKLLAIGSSGQVARAIITASTSGGLIRRKSKHGSFFAFLPVKDRDGVFEVVLFSDVLWEHGEHIKPNSQIRMLVEASGNESPGSILRVLSIEEVSEEEN